MYLWRPLLPSLVSFVVKNMSPSPLSLRLRETVRRSPVAWARACGIRLRPYQVPVALAIKDSILHQLGLTFVVMFARQSGKSEIQSHLLAWLLYRFSNIGGLIVSVSPTYHPQTIINMRRVRDSLNSCVGSRGLWHSSDGYVYELGKAQLQFFSGAPRSNVMSATANILLSVDEAQSITIAKFDREFDPMTASANATRVFWGTAWTDDTLLERERRIALRDQQQDGRQRLFFYTADDICRVVPAYARHMERIIATHGRNHPGVRSQYFCETIDSQSGLFTPARLSLIFSSSPLSQSERLGEEPVLPVPVPQALASLTKESGEAPQSGARSAAESASASPLSKSAGFGEGAGEGSGSSPIAFLLDVAGMDESKLSPLHSLDLGLGNPGRDSTALSIVQIDLSSVETLGFPTYHVVARHSWVGENHLSVLGKLKALAETWHPQHIVMDATGVGEGLWSMLERAFPTRVLPVKFTQLEKSELGWRFLSIIETGRFRSHVNTDEVRLQYSHCISEILPGPLKTLRWGVPNGTRGPDGELIHDDFVVADSLVAKLDGLKWRLSSPAVLIPARDSYPDMDHYFSQDHDDHYFSSLFSL